MKAEAGPTSQRNGKGYECIHKVRDMSASLDPYYPDACYQNGLPSAPGLPLPSTYHVFHTLQIPLPDLTHVSHPYVHQQQFSLQVYNSHMLFMVLLHPSLTM